MTNRFSPDRPNLIWLEDRDTTAQVEVSEARRLGCTVFLRAHPVEIMALLEDELGRTPRADTVNQFKITFIIDIMIAGLLDLSHFGIQNSETNGGLNGGFIFADRVLREKNSVYRHRPICFLSERQLDFGLADDLEYLRQRQDSDGTPHGALLYMKKSRSSELRRFREFLTSL